MKHSVFTFSRAELIDLCPWIASDGAPDLVKGDGPGDDAKIGRAFHRVENMVINKGMGTSPAYLIDGALKAEGLDVEKYRLRLTSLRPIEHALFAMKAGGPATTTEVSYSIDLSDGSAVQVGKDLNRQYDPKPGHIFGTVDLLHGEADTLNGTYTIVIGDWKVGPMARQEITPADRNKQMGLAAMAVMGAHQPEQVRVELRFISADGDLFIDSYVYDSTSIAEIDTWLQDLEQRIDSATEPTPGAHCAGKRCPLLSVCPAVQKSIDEIVTLANMKKQELAIEPAPTPTQQAWPLNVTSVDQIQCEDHARLILARARAVKRLCEQMLDACQDYTDQSGPISLGGGKIYGPKERITREIKGNTVEEIKAALAKFLPSEELAVLVYATSPKTKLVNAIKARAAIGEGKMVERNALAELRNAGLIDETKVIEHRDHKPRADKKAVEDDDDE